MKTASIRMILPTLAAAVLLGGCASHEYSTQVRNRTGQTVRIDFVGKKLIGNNEKVMTNIAVGAGDSERFEFTSSSGQVKVTADARGNEGLPQSVTIKPGYTQLEVNDKDSTSETTFSLTAKRSGG